MHLPNPIATLDDRAAIRLLLFTCLVIAGAWLATSYVTDDTRAAVSAYHDQAELPRDERTPVVEPRERMTVAIGQPAPASNSKALYAFRPDGRLYYYSDAYGLSDIDPSPAGKYTILTAPQYRAARSNCPTNRRCSAQYLARINMTTNTSERFHHFTTPRWKATNWHDVDRVGEHRYAIASIAFDHVRVVNVTSDTWEWGWHAQHGYNLSGGGPWPRDWTHLNDVERLPDGRYMLSLRNQDSVVFVDPEEGLQEEWTLGCDNCFETLNEQHNPDYIPEAQGGPAVVVADSENDRVVEYQRRNGEWEQTWVWKDTAMDWPRDADRLPNGHTLIADSVANRVIEVDRQGEIVWEARVPNVYDVERLGTGDESAGGPSAVRANLTSRVAPSEPLYIDQESRMLKGGWLTIQLNKIRFVLPDWMGLFDLVFVAAGLVVLLVWVAIEAYWRGVRYRWPIHVR
jgi:hypothetical protein